MLNIVSWFSRRKNVDFISFFREYQEAKDANKKAKLKDSFCTNLSAYFNHRKEALSEYFLPNSEVSFQVLLEQELSRLLAETSTTNKNLKEKFTTYVDRLLIDALRDERPKHYERASNFYHQWFESLRDTKHFERLVSELDYRTDAWNMAYVIFIRKVKDQKYKGKSNTFTFFYSCFEKECLAARKHLGRGKSKMHSYVFDDPLSKLSPEIQEKLSEPPHVFSDDFLKLMEDYDPECYALLMERDKGYKFRELAELYNSTDRILRQAARKCRDKFFKYWQKNNPSLDNE